MGQFDHFVPDGGQPGYFGLYPAIVTDIVDPDRLGRIEVKLPWLGEAGDEVRAWATLLSPYAEKDQGFLAYPAVDTQVVVGFEAGNLRRPYIVGAAWNGVETPPEAAAEPNNKRLIKTRSGSLLEFDDTPGAVKVTLLLQSGHKLVLSDASQEAVLSHANGSSITFAASGDIVIKANAKVELTATALNVHAPTATFDGIVNCTTLNASAAVVSPAYTPGLGNIW